MGSRPAAAGRSHRRRNLPDPVGYHRRSGAMGRLHDLAAAARAHWRIPAALAGLILTLAAASAVHRHLLIIRLLEADADAIDRSSGSFAEREAAPLYRELCAGCHGA